MSELRSLYLCDKFAQCVRKDKLDNDLDIQVKVPFRYVPGGTAENHEHFGIGGLQVERLSSEPGNNCRMRIDANFSTLDNSRLYQEAALRMFFFDHGVRGFI